MGKRIIYIDIAKGIAIILVILGHTLQYMGANSEYTQNVLYLLIYSFHMPLFMFLSGMLFLKSLGRAMSLKEILFRRTKALMYPYILWGAIALAVEYLLKNIYGTASLKEIIANTSLYWFLLSCWISSIIVAACFFFSNALNVFLSRAGFNVDIFPALVVIACGLWFLSGVRDRDAWMCVFFIAGCLITIDHSSSRRGGGYCTTRLLSVICLASLVLMILFSLNSSEADIRYLSGYRCILNADDFMHTLMFLIRACLGIVFTLSLSFLLCRKNSLKGVKMISKVGVISLQLYLLQKLLIEEAFAFITQNGIFSILNELPEWTFSLTALLIAFFFTWLLYCVANVLNENLKVRRFLFGK